MLNQQLLDYIKQELSKNISKEQIKGSLITNGWEDSDIEEGFNALESQYSTSSLIPKPQINQTSKKLSPWTVCIVVLILTIISAYGYFYYSKSDELVKTPTTKDTSESIINNSVPSTTQSMESKNCGTIRDDASAYLVGIQTDAQPTVNEKAAVLCMDNAITDCSLATITSTRTDQSISFKVEGKENENCIISTGNFGDKKITTCKIPSFLIQEFIEQPQKDIENLFSYIELILVSEIPISGTKTTTTILGHTIPKLDCISL